MNVIVTGTLGFDYIMNFSGKFADRIMPDKIHQISLSFLVDTFSKNLGGTAGNIAYTLKLLGIEPLLLSTAGSDFGPYKQILKKYAISTKYIREYKEVITGSYFVITDNTNNQIGSFYTGATKYADRLSVSDAPPADLVIIAPTESRAMNKYVKECVQAKIPYLFDPAFQINDFAHKDLLFAIKNTAILIGNDYEIALIQEKLKMSYDELYHTVPILITTLGAKGSLIESKKEGKIVIKAARPKSEIDPTGAGDAYRAGFIAGFARGFTLKTCGQMGSVATIYTVEKYGTQTHEFTLSGFVKRYKENFGENLQLV